MPAWLRDRAVAYLNVDSAASGSRFVAGASASLMRVIADAAGAVRDPSANVSVLSAARAQRRSRPRRDGRRAHRRRRRSSRRGIGLRGLSESPRRAICRPRVRRPRPDVPHALRHARLRRTDGRSRVHLHHDAGAADGGRRIAPGRRRNRPDRSGCDCVECPFVLARGCASECRARAARRVCAPSKPPSTSSREPRSRSRPHATRRSKPATAPSIRDLNRRLLQLERSFVDDGGLPGRAVVPARADGAGALLSARGAAGAGGGTRFRGFPAGFRRRPNGSPRPCAGRPRCSARASRPAPAFNLRALPAAGLNRTPWLQREFASSWLRRSPPRSWSHGRRPPRSPATQRAILHVLNRVGFGPTAAAIEQVKRVGVQSYIDAQLHPGAAARYRDGRAALRLHHAFEELARSGRRILHARDARTPQRAAACRADGGVRRRRPQRPGSGAHARADRGDAHAAQRHRRAVAAADPARGLQRASARRGPRRLLDESLQRVRGQGPGAELPDRIRARRRPPASVRQVPRSARRDGSEPGDALLSRQLAERRARRRRHHGGG